MKLNELIDIKAHDVKWLHGLDEKGLLVVDNSFQRNYVWTVKNQIKLIESILLSYPIPEIYLWNIGTNEETGNTTYSIVDGQQRAGAVFQYIANSFSLNAKELSDTTGPYDRIKDKLFKDLEPDDKKAVWSYVFSVRIIRNIVPRRDIVSMFLRLNSNNLTLNPQELRNAEFEGEFMNFTSELSELPFWDDNNLFGIADRRRMRDISFISTLLVFMKEGIEEDVSNTNLNRVYDLYNDTYPSKEKDRQRFKNILEIIDTIIAGNNGRIKVLKRQVHLYSLFTALYELTIDGTEITMDQIESYQAFLDSFDNTTELQNKFPKIMINIYQYRALSKEGTRSKANRIERHGVVKGIFNYSN